MQTVEYLKPANMNELAALMQQYAARTTVIAGGTNLIPDMRNGRHRPEVLLDISDLKAMNAIALNDDHLSIGAAATIVRIAADATVNAHCPILAAAAAKLGNPLTRNRATIGGNLANASPCADTAPPLLSLEALVEIMDVKGQQRQVPLDKFFRGYKWTDLAPGEVITRIVVPKPSSGMQGGHTKLGLRKAAAICVASVAVMLEKENDHIAKARVAFGSVAPKPIRAYRLEAFFEGKAADATLLSQCEPILQQEIAPISDIRGSEAYRRQVTAVIFKRNLQELLWS